MTNRRAQRHAKQMGIALYEGDIDKARHEHLRMEKALGGSPVKGREERFRRDIAYVRDQPAHIDRAERTR